MKYIGENAIKKLISLIKSDIKKKLDKNQGTANSGKILGVDASGEVAPTDTEVATLVDVPNGIVKGDGSTLSAAVAGTDYVTPDGMNSAVAETKPFIVMMNDDNTTNKTVTEIKAAHDAGRACFFLAESYIPLIAVNDSMALFQSAVLMGAGPATSVSILSVEVTNENNVTISTFPCQRKIQATGLLKGNGNGGVGAAVAGTDYMVPVTGGTAGQILTKTTDGQEWQDREKDLFVVNMTANDSGTIASSDRTFDEVKAAYNTGKTVIANLYLSPISAYYILPSVAFQPDEGIVFAAVNRNNSIGIMMTPTVIVIQEMAIQDQITASGLLKGDGEGGVSAAVVGTDYMAPVTGGTAGQVLTKTADGQEWQDREKDLFVVTISGDDSSGYTADKTFAEIKAAYDEGKTVVAITTVGMMTCRLFLVYIADTLVQFSAALFDFSDGSAILSITMDNNNYIERNITVNQAMIDASGLLKGDGNGGVSAATAGTDYMVPPTGGTTGQVLTKTANSSEWADAPKSLPEGGTAGDALVKSTDGGSWETPVEASLVDLPVITASQTDLTAGTSPLATGELYVVYE